MNSISKLTCLMALATLGLTQAVDLASTADYAVLAVTGITNSGLTVIEGSIGTSGASITGFPPGVFSGTTATGTPATVQGSADAATAWDAALALTPATVSNPILDDQTFLPGIYSFNSSVTLSGTLTLDADSDSSSTWVFQIPGTSTITTASLSQILIVNGGLASNVFWAVGTSATLGATSVFVGDLVVDVSITVNTGASIDESLYAGAAVTLVENDISGN